MTNEATLAFECLRGEQRRRILALDELLRKRLTRPEILKRLRDDYELPTSERTFWRDLEFMQEVLGAPLDYNSDPHNPKEQRWFYTDESWSVNGITEGDLFSLALARIVVSQYGGTPIAGDLERIYKRLAAGLEERVTVRHNPLAPISFSRPSTEPVRPGIWNAVLSAAMNRQTLKIRYRPLWGERRAKCRRVDPYHVVNLQGTWYLLASAGLSDPAVRQYAMAQIHSARPTGAHFTMPADFDIEAILDNAFGRFIGDPRRLVPVKVRFSREVAPLVTSQHFHPRERKRRLAGGDIEVSFPVSPVGPWPFYHVVGWVLSWGRHAKVVSPDELRQRVAEEVSQMSEACTRAPQRGRRGGGKPEHREEKEAAMGRKYAKIKSVRRTIYKKLKFKGPKIRWGMR